MSLAQHSECDWIYETLLYRCYFFYHVCAHTLFFLFPPPDELHRKKKPLKFLHVLRHFFSFYMHDYVSLYVYTSTSALCFLFVSKLIPFELEKHKHSMENLRFVIELIWNITSDNWTERKGKKNTQNIYKYTQTHIPTKCWM